MTGMLVDAVGEGASLSGVTGDNCGGDTIRCFGNDGFVEVVLLDGDDNAGAGLGRGMISSSEYDKWLFVAAGALSF